MLQKTVVAPAQKQERWYEELGLEEPGLEAESYSFSLGKARRDLDRAPRPRKREELRKNCVELKSPKCRSTR